MGFEKWEATFGEEQVPVQFLGLCTGNLERPRIEWAVPRLFVEPKEGVDEEEDEEDEDDSEMGDSY